MLLRMPPSWAGEFASLPAPDALEHTLEMAGVGVKERGATPDDTWTLEITSNRGDLLSAHGLARDLAAMSNETVKLPSTRVEEVGQAAWRVTLDAPDACPRYTARLLEVEVAPSPEWMQRRLEACGMRPINNIVDVTNYVMLELGQPLHAFDADTLPSARIVVRMAREGETLRTLDDVERALSPEMLVIADATRPIALAGVIGGSETEVSDATRHVLLESAHFSPLAVKRTSRRTGLSTEASRRFERGVDPNLPARASARAAQLLQDVANARVYEINDAVAEPFSPAQLSMRVARCNAVLGLKLGGETMAQLLSRLGFAAQLQGENISVTVPSWRSDIEREIDLVEEVARLHGYNHVPTTLPRGANASAGRSLAGRLEERAKSALLRCGLSEVLTLSLSNVAAQERAGLREWPETQRRVPLRNALSDDYTQLRTSMLPSLLEVLARNARLELDAPPQLFELGHIYLSRDPASLDSASRQPEERRSIGLATLSTATPPHWSKRAPTVDFFTLKGAIQAMLREVGAPEGEFRAAQEPGFHPGRCASLSVDGQFLGVLGEAHPDVAARYDLDAKQRAYLAQIDFDALVRHVSLSRRHASLPRFPEALRDLALIVSNEVSASRVEDVLRQACGEHLEALRVFDVYTGPPISEGQKSLAVALRFRAPDRTLREDELEAALTRARGAARELLGATLRE